jgi:hypothetical protein
MGSIGTTTDTLTVSLPDNPKAWSCTNLPATNTRKPVTEEHIAALREIVQKADDGSKMLVPGDEGYEDSLRRWSRAAEKRAVSTHFLLLLRWGGIGTEWLAQRGFCPVLQSGDRYSVSGQLLDPGTVFWRKTGLAIQTTSLSSFPSFPSFPTSLFSNFPHHETGQPVYPP